MTLKRIGIFAVLFGALFLITSAISRLSAGDGFSDDLDKIAKAVKRKAQELQEPSRPGRQEPISAGLRAQSPIPADDRGLDRAGFVRFERSPDEEAPFGDNVRFNGRFPSDADERKVFKEDHWAFLPRDSRITRRMEGKQERWDYPTGTRLIHRIFLNTDPIRLFELRMLEKRDNGRWAYGTYAPARDGRLTLLRRQEDLEFSVSVGSQTFNVTVRRLNPEGCRQCHWGHSANDYPDIPTAGPCDFGPANRTLVERWGRAFQDKHGYNPFGPLTRS